MENVMNFLSANYIWFFVLAGILCFALVGFIIDSKKKKTNEFKGDSIDVSAEPNADITGETIDLGTPVSFETMSEPINQTEEVSLEEPKDFITSQPTLESANEMVINDIPMNFEEDANLNEVPVNPELESFGEMPTFGEPITDEKPTIEPTIEPVSTNIVSDEGNEDIEMFEELK